jgi:hypothetical protein
MSDTVCERCGFEFRCRYDPSPRPKSRTGPMSAREAGYCEAQPPSSGFEDYGYCQAADPVIALTAEVLAAVDSHVQALAHSGLGRAHGKLAEAKARDKDVCKSCYAPGCPGKYLPLPTPKGDQ